MGCRQRRFACLRTLHRQGADSATHAVQKMPFTPMPTTKLYYSHACAHYYYYHSLTHPPPLPHFAAQLMFTFTTTTTTTTAILGAKPLLSSQENNARTHSHLEFELELDRQGCTDTRGRQPCQHVPIIVTPRIPPCYRLKANTIDRNSITKLVQYICTRYSSRSSLACFEQLCTKFSLLLLGCSLVFIFVFVLVCCVTNNTLCLPRYCCLRFARFGLSHAHGMPQR